MGTLTPRNTNQRIVNPDDLFGTIQFSLFRFTYVTVSFCRMRDRWTERDGKLAANNPTKTRSAPSITSTNNVWSQAHHDPPHLVSHKPVPSMQPRESAKAHGWDGRKQSGPRGNGEGGNMTVDNFERSTRDSSISKI